MNMLRVQSDWVQRFKNDQGMECIEAFFLGSAYARHRHDTYAIGRTLSGVQSFNYRGAMRHSLTGQTLVLHPDEAHDGQAGTDEGFRYRMIYLEPSLLQEIIGGKCLPFIEHGVTSDQRLANAAAHLLDIAANRMESLELDDAVAELALVLEAAAGIAPKRRVADYASAVRVRELLDDNWTGSVALEEMAAVAGKDRWSLSRDFRTFFGTSPHRYLTMRRLDAARQAMTRGVGLVDAAALAGFADQSHMTRHFKKAYGMTPAKWLSVANHRIAR